MDTIVFDGRSESKKILESVGKKVSKGVLVKPRLVSILVGDDPGSILYLSIKKKAAEEIGALLEIKRFNENCSKDEIIGFIKQENQNAKTDGIMVQLPLPECFFPEDEEKIIESIEDKLDVDGMKRNSSFITPVVLAVDHALNFALEKKKDLLKNLCLVIVGSKGFVGKHLFNFYKEKNYQVFGIDSASINSADIIKNADIVISATGNQGIIKKDSIKEGSIVIDVGAPKGDVVLEEIMGDAFFVSPVPGGIGPLTVSFLMQNLIVSFLKRQV